MEKVYYVYMLECEGTSELYVGMTGDLDQRLVKHFNGTAAKFTKQFPPKRVVQVLRYCDKKKALKTENQLKRRWQWSDIEKRVLEAARYTP